MKASPRSNAACPPPVWELRNTKGRATAEAWCFFLTEMCSAASGRGLCWGGQARPEGDQDGLRGSPRQSTAGQAGREGEEHMLALTSVTSRSICGEPASEWPPSSTHQRAAGCRGPPGRLPPQRAAHPDPQAAAAL